MSRFIQWRSSYTRPLVGIITTILLAALAFFIFSTPQVVGPLDSLNSTPPETPLTQLPARLLIPSINVDADVQSVGLDTTNTSEMGVPDNFTDVGWYKYGPRPGAPGSAVITGHLNGKNVPEAVFYDLSSVKIDDEIFIVDETGFTLTFKVVEVRTYTHDSPTDEVFISNDGKVRLNLITCAGNWLGDEELYDQRTVVFTELVSEVD